MGPAPASMGYLASVAVVGVGPIRHFTKGIGCSRARVGREPTLR